MNRWLVVGAIVVLAGGAGAGVWSLRGTGVSTWVRDPRKALKPARLVPVHEAVKELTDCDSCHALEKAIPNDKCYDCHEIIRERRRARLGYHGKSMRGACHDCHVDHEPELIVFDRETFNHEQAIFSLRGRHADLECAACHERPTGIEAQPTRMQYIGLEHDTCVACHEDPHAGTLTDDRRTCLDCHDQDAWTKRHLRFVHDRDSTFRLDGKHADVACTGCHLPPEGSQRLADAPLAGLDTTCAGCHTDPHAAQFVETACETCHVASGFTGGDVRFRHETLPAFRLEGAHATVECAECHRDDAALGARRFRGTATTCAGCHEDPHAGQFADTACASCHQARAFTGDALLFDHRTLAEFPLGGAHVAVECAKCHVPAEGVPTTFRGTSQDCASCHEDPHGGQFEGTACASCHRDSGFAGDHLAFRHERLEAFPLTGAHAVVACADCHAAPAEGAPAVFRGRGTTCDSCHEDPHAGSVAEKTCATCHATAGWKGTNLLFDHSGDAAFALDAAHAPLPCAACHEAPAFRPLPTDCAECHADVADALAGRPDAGHDTAFEPSPHADLVACVKCHDPADGESSTATIAPRCASCHTPRYAKLALDRRALLDDLHVRGAAVLAATPGRADADAVRERLVALRRAAAHDFAPAERRLRELVESLER